MIDFSKYTLQEQQVMNDLLHDLVTQLEERHTIWEYLRWMCTKSDNQIVIAINQQASDAAEAPAEQARDAADPAGNVPLAKVQLSSLYGKCIAGDPPAEEPDDLRVVVDALSVCSDRLAALARPAEMYFEESGRMDVFLKLTTLRDSNRAIRNVLWDISDCFDLEAAGND